MARKSLRERVEAASERERGFPRGLARVQGHLTLRGFASRKSGTREPRNGESGRQSGSRGPDDWAVSNSTGMLGMVTVAKAGFALLVGLGVFFLLAPTSGADSRCFSLLTEVPCSGELAFAAGAVAAAVVGLALWLMGRRRAT